MALPVNSTKNSRELKRTILAPFLERLYGHSFLRRICVGLVLKAEGGELLSATLREILHRYHSVTVGAHSYGECMKPGRFPPGVIIGRYVSVAEGVKVFRRNHPIDRISTHPYFYNKDLGRVSRDTICEGAPLIIEHDVWIGARAIITPRCLRIGLGAIIGAGSVVTSDVPDFAVVVGAPARVVRYRFPRDYQASIRMGKWWDLPIEILEKHQDAMQISVDAVPRDHPFLPDTRTRYQE